MAMPRCRCYWQVTAGLVPGERPDASVSRRFEITTDEWGNVPARDALLTARYGAAHAWATHLEHLAARQGFALNWVRVEFFWL